VIVVDASAGIELISRSDPQGRRIADAIAEEFFVHVPELFDLEMLQALRRAEARDTLRATGVDEALAALGELRAVRYDHAPLRPRIWSLRHNLTAYDAAYVALAELLEATLLTTDARLARSGGHEAEVELIAAR
jgi:predicted nucleic acid-binding protein